MGIVSRIRQNFRADLSLTNPKAWDRTLWNLVGSQSLSGENVNEYSALNYSAVYNAITLYSGTIGSLPLHLFREEGKRKVLEQKKSVAYVMGRKANPYMTSKNLREVMVAHMFSWGNAYAEKVRNGYGEIVELWPITPDRVRLEMEGQKLIYIIRVGNEEKRLTRDNILHIPGLGFDGFQGYSVIAMARKSIGLGMAMETFGSLYFGQGTHPGVVVSHPGKLSQIAHDNLEKALTTSHSGLGQTHRLMLLEEAMKIEKLGISPEDSQFLESRQFQIPELARWFNLPPHKLKDLTRSSFNNIESEQISFVTDSILPPVIGIEQNYDMQLLTENDQRIQKLYFKHNLEGLLRGNPATRATFYKEMWMIGSISQNEIRGKEDMDPIEGGDKYYVPLNMVAVEDVGKVPESSPAPINPKLPKLIAVDQKVKQIIGG